jgi:hypothetical protein
MWVKAGDVVIHKKYGMGKILKADNINRVYAVRFDHETYVFGGNKVKEITLLQEKE